MDTRDAVRKVLFEEIRRQRRTRGEVSRKAGIAKNTLYRIEEGADPTASTLWSLAEALHVPMAEIAFRVDQWRSGRLMETEEEENE